MTQAPAGPRLIRACMISFYFLPNYSGSAIQARNLSRHLVKHGVQASVVSANLSGGLALEVVDGLPIHRLRVAQNRQLQIPSFWAGLLWFLLRHRNDFDVFHAHGTLQHGSASIAGRLAGRPTILKVAMANSDIAFARQGRVNGLLNRFMVRLFDRYIATTESIANEFSAEGLDVSRVCRIPNGVDTDTYAPAAAVGREALRRTLGLPRGPIIIYVGILNRRKNVDGVLRIWRSAVTNGAAGHLVLLGPPPPAGDSFLTELTGFQQLPELAGRISMVGFRDNVAAYLQASDVFLFPSRQEGMPNVVLEAMACGLPVLVSHATGVDTVVSHGVDGFAYPLDDESAFAHTVQELLADAQLRDRIGGAARRTVEARFSLAAIAERYAHLYAELVPAR